MTGENGLIGVMTHELTFNELVVESQHLLKLQSDKNYFKKPVLSQLNALVRCHFRRFRSDVLFVCAFKIKRSARNPYMIRRWQVQCLATASPYGPI